MRDTPEATPLDPPDHIDVAVIGGGVIGLSSAIALSARGVSVVVLERGEIGGGASTHNAGQIRPAACVPLSSPGAVADTWRSIRRPGRPVRLGPRAVAQPRWLAAFSSWSGGADLAQRTAALGELGRTSAQAYTAIERHCSHPILEAKGALDLYETDRAWLDARSQRDTLAQYGFAAELISGDDARRLEPILSDRVLGGVWFEQAAHCNPTTLIAALAALAEDQGTRLLEHADVTAIERAGGSECLTVGGSLVQAEAVVLASGWHGGQLLPRREARLVPVIPGRGYGVDANLAEPLRRPLVFVERHVAATPLPGSRARITSGMELAHRGSTLSGQRLRGMIRAARPMLHGIETAPRGGWIGHRPMAPDGLPVIGRLPGRERVVVATGHGMLGLTHGPGTGELVAQLLTGDRPGWAAAFEPDRFCHGWRPGRDGTRRRTTVDKRS